MKYAFGIDIGTTGIKAALVDSDGRALAYESAEQKQYFPRPGWCEQDPDEILRLSLEVFSRLLEKTGLKPSDIACIGLDHQGESCLVWEKATGRPVYPVITWQDRRMAAVSDEFGREYGERIRELTGLRSDSYYSAWKIRWILDNIPDGQKRAQSGELLAGTLNTWLFWNYSGRKAFVTDESSSDVMMLCDPRQTGWNPWLLEKMDIPRIMLPEIVPCNSVLAETDPALFGARIPVTCSLADCSAGIVASGAVSEGDLTVTYGTGSFLHLITGGRFVVPTEGLTAACSFAMKSRKAYQLNGICYTAGSAVKWLKNGLGLIQSASETETLARSVENSGGVHFVPALNGLATPFWDQGARGAFIGLTAASTKAHLVRAVLESCALQVANCSRIMKKVSGTEISRINAMGGMTVNSFLMQLQADLCGMEVTLPAQTEPCYGAACMAFTGITDDFRIEDLRTMNPPVRTYKPAMDRAESDRLIDGWADAVKRTLNCYPDRV